MPLRTTRYEYTKVYRPNGMRFAEAHATTLEDAIDLAKNLFVQEFGALQQSIAVIEAVGATGQWYVTIMEVPNGPI